MWHCCRVFFIVNFPKIVMYEKLYMGTIEC